MNCQLWARPANCCRLFALAPNKRWVVELYQQQQEQQLELACTWSRVRKKMIDTKLDAQIWRAKLFCSDAHLAPPRDNEAWWRQKHSSRRQKKKKTSVFFFFLCRSHAFFLESNLTMREMMLVMSFLWLFFINAIFYAVQILTQTHTHTQKTSLDSSVCNSIEK